MRCGHDRPLPGWAGSTISCVTLVQADRVVDESRAAITGDVTVTCVMKTPVTVNGVGVQSLLCFICSDVIYYRK